MFTRDELLGGLPARRASTILFAIEGATARLVAASRIDRAAYISERTAAEREQAFLQAVASGGELPRPPAIADIERVAAGWGQLVPEAPDVRAAIARLLGRKHRFRRSDVPAVRAALGLDEPAVEAAFGRLYGESLDTIYASRLSVAEQARWLRARLSRRFDRLPPFWIAYFLAITETLGEGILAVPIALAGLGPLPGVALLLFLGLVNLVTMGALTESVIRNGSMRYGAAYFSRLATDLLGRLPASSLSLALGLFNVLTFFVYFLGFGSVLAGATGVHVGVWILVLFALNVFLLRKETLDDTVASAVLIGSANLALVVAITAIALVNVDPSNVGAGIPLLDGRPPDALTLGLAFGIVLTAFFGHTSAANASKLVLTLEPSGRSLLWGNLAALATVIGLYCVAAVAFIGVLGPDALVGTPGTAITPLGEAIPIVQLLGSLYVILAVGIGSLYITLGLYNQVVELLPRPTAAPTRGLLARMAASRRGRLALGFAPAAAVCLGLELLVLSGQASFAEVLGIGGALLVPVITGVFPMLLIVAARRKGEYVPGTVLRIVGHPLVVAGSIALYILVLALHGLVIWDGPLERLAATAMSVAMVALVAWTWRGGAFRRRAVVELRRDLRRERTTLSVTTAGRSVVLDAPVEGEPADARTIVPAGPWHELRVWPHEVSPDGWSTPLAAVIDIGGRPAIEGGADHEVVVPIDGTATTVHVILTDAAGA